jgi:hypothetical protein
MPHRKCVTTASPPGHTLSWKLRRFVRDVSKRCLQGAALSQRRFILKRKVYGLRVGRRIDTLRATRRMLSARGTACHLSDVDLSEHGCKHFDLPSNLTARQNQR